jgi:hypothetical protein
MSLILPNLLGPELVRWLLKILRKIADDANVGSCATMRVITALDFFQHLSAQLGHGDLLISVTQLINLSIPPSLLISEPAVASAAPAASYESP